MKPHTTQKPSMTLLATLLASSAFVVGWADASSGDAPSASQYVTPSSARITGTAAHAGESMTTVNAKATDAPASTGTSTAPVLTGNANVAAPEAWAKAAPNNTVPCTIDETRNFGATCFAAAVGQIADGSSATFPNARPGYRGSTQANCNAGTVTWSKETCTAATLLSTATAGRKQAVATAAGAAATTATAAATATASPDYDIGVYYFGGWKNNQVGASSATPWAALERYPDREPLLGRYAEDGDGVMSQQLKWMRQYGIDFVVFNWYWARHNAPMLDHSVKAYLALANKPKVKFAVQWSNHTEYNYSRDQLDAMFSYWVNNYFNKPEHQLYAGKPVVYIFSAPTWARNAAAIGLTSAQLIDRLNNAAKAAGLPGVSVIGGLWGGDKMQDYSASTGFAAFTMYNYKSPANIALQPTRTGNHSRSYAELHQAYANQWDWMLKNTTSNYIVPMSSGWDKRPWGGSSDPLHDDSRSLPAEFSIHLQAAKTFMDANVTRTKRTGVICCWNEFGEGSFIEPTKVDQFKYLQSVSATFGTN